MITYLLTKYENSKFYQNRLIKKHKPKLNVGTRSFDEIIELLSKEFDLLKIEADEVDSTFWKYGVLENISDSSALQFKIFEIKRNEKSIALYQYAEEVHGIVDDNIVIVFEESTKYMTSNCDNVYTKMFILQGVSEFDYNNETPEFILYLRVLDGYLKEAGNVKQKI